KNKYRQKSSDNYYWLVIRVVYRRSVWIRYAGGNRGSPLSCFGFPCLVGGNYWFDGAEYRRYVWSYRNTGVNRIEQWPNQRIYRSSRQIDFFTRSDCSDRDYPCDNRNVHSMDNDHHGYNGVWKKSGSEKMLDNRPVCDIFRPRLYGALLIDGYISRP